MEAFDLIRYKIKQNVKRSLSKTIQKRENFPDTYHQLDVRRVATELAKQVVYKAMLLRKGAIYVCKKRKWIHLTFLVSEIIYFLSPAFV